MTVDQAIRYYNSQQRLANALKVRSSTISNWKVRGHIPALQQLRLERMTGGQLLAAGWAKG